MVQDNLKFSEHCKKVALTANRIIGQVRRSFTRKEPNIMMQIYNSYILPHLDYGASVWSPHLQKDINILEAVQRRFTRLIEGMSGLTYEERLTVLGIPTLQERREFIDLTQVFRLKNDIDIIGRPMFKTISDVHCRKTRGSVNGHLVQCQSRLEARRHFFTNRIISSWNCLPQEVKASRSLNMFKSKLRKSKF